LFINSKVKELGKYFCNPHPIRNLENILNEFSMLIRRVFHLSVLKRRLENSTLGFNDFSETAGRRRMID